MSLSNAESYAVLSLSETHFLRQALDGSLQTPELSTCALQKQMPSGGHVSALVCMLFKPHSVFLRATPWQLQRFYVAVNPTFCEKTTDSGQSSV